MASRTLQRITRGDVVRGLGKTWDDFPDSISDAIDETMRKVPGAELVLRRHGRMEDEFDLVYNIQPEGLTLHVELGTAVGRTLTGDYKKFDSATERIYRAFRG